MKKLRLKNLEVIQIETFDVTTSSLFFADEEQLFFTQADKKFGTEEQSPERREPSRENPADWVANGNHSFLMTSLLYLKKDEGNKMPYASHRVEHEWSKTSTEWRKL